MKAIQVNEEKGKAEKQLKVIFWYKMLHQRKKPMGLGFRLKHFILVI